MSKPEDISQEAWDATKPVLDLIFDQDGIWHSNLQSRIARAIMAATQAEREACAVVAQERYTSASVIKKRNGTPYASGEVAIHAAAQIAAAIRKRGEG